MRSRIGRVFDFLFSVNREERLKILLITGVFFFVIGGYTVSKELKDSIFVTVVGKEFVPWAKMLSMFVLVPAILFYAYLVDRLRRYQLLYCCSAFFGIGGLLFAYFLGHPTIGIQNVDASPYRLFGWLFYFFVEGYSPFLVSVAWAFANSISSPESAKNNYSLLVGGSKLGGMLTSAFAWYLLSRSLHHGLDPYAVYNHQLLLVVSSAILLFVPLVTSLLVRAVPGTVLHGYEAVYQVEKERSKQKAKPGLFSGLFMLMRQPYTLGIFSMIFFYEAINVVLNYQRLLIAKDASLDISGMSVELFKQMFWVHFFTFAVSLIGTNAILRTFGERRSLMLVPLGIGASLALFMFYRTPAMVTLIYIWVRVLYYSIGYPVRECLYIPTVKEVKFKSKSWIDAFGGKLSKFAGSQFNVFSQGVLKVSGISAFFAVQSLFFAAVVGLWVVASYLMGRRFERAVMNNEVIGLGDEETSH